MVRDTAKIVMAALALAGITGMYLQPVRRKRRPRPGRLPACSPPATSDHVHRLVVAAFVLPTLADTDPGFVNDVIARRHRRHARR